MEILLKIKKNKQKIVLISKGFSLIEVLVALFIFSLIVVTTSKVYVEFLAAQQNAVATQKILEGAQVALNSLAKTLRTSKIVSDIDDHTKIRVFDYSSTGNACMEYAVTAERLEISSAPLDEAGCTAGATLGAPIVLISNKVYGGFIVTPNPAVPGEIGKATVSLQLCPQKSDSASCSDTVGNPIKIQTTVSLRMN